MLNDYRDEAGAFLSAIGVENEEPDRIFEMPEEEVRMLRTRLGDRDALCHQVYDVLFLLFELAARFSFDVDAEWENGRAKKQKKYLNPERIGQPPQWSEGLHA